MLLIFVFGLLLMFFVWVVFSKINMEVSVVFFLEGFELEIDLIMFWNRYVDWLY